MILNEETRDRFFERGMLALILAILVYAPLAMGAVGTHEFLVVQALAMAVMFLWAVRLALTPKPRFFWPPICWAVLAFALYAVARYLTADIEYVARFEMIQTLLYAFLFFAIVNNLTSKESAHFVALVMIFLAAAISCYAVWQFMAHSKHVWNYISLYPGRASGTYISPNNFSCFLEMLLPLALAFLLAGRVKPFTRVLIGYSALAMGAGLAVTFSRGGWVAAGAGVFLLLAVLITNRKHWLPALVLLIALLIAGSVFVTRYLSRTLSYVERVQAVEQSDSVDLGYRSEMWKAAEEMWRDHFWFGVGPAHYDYRFRQYRPPNVQGRPDRAHNDYLNLLADWGVTGGVIVAAGMVFFVTALGKTWKSVWPGKNDMGRGMSNRFAFFIGACAALFALAIHSVVDFNLHIPANALVGVALLGFLTCQLRSATGDYRLEARVPAKALAAIILLSGIGYFGYQGYWRYQESLWLARAQNNNLLLLDRAGLLEKAFNAEPKNFLTAYNIGEFYRLQSFEGGDDYESLAQTAIQWYARGMKLDPYDGYNYLSTGMCLDWLGRSDESPPDYSRAETLDPNGSYMVAYIGWHYIQTGDYAAARVWMLRSMRLEWDVNPIAHNYWDIIEDKLAQNASGQPQLPPGF